MKLTVTGFKDTGTDSFDHIYFFKAVVGNGDQEHECLFELTNSEIAELVDEDGYHLPVRFDFGVYEPLICQMLVFIHRIYWRDEDGILEGATIEINKPVLGA